MATLRTQTHSNVPDPSPQEAFQLSGRSPLSTLTGVQILATGSYAPQRVVPNEELAELGVDPEWIIQRTGIRERRFAAPGESTSDMAYEASLRCLSAAGASVKDIDMIIVGTMTPDHGTPSSACNLQNRLGARAPAMDINAACSGFMYGLVTGMQFIKNGCAQRILVVGADVMSSVINPHDKVTYPLFGDGAGAVLIGPGSDQQGFLSYTLGAEGDAGEFLSQPAGGSREPLTQEAFAQGRHFVRMDGRAVFKWAIRVVGDAVSDVLRYAELTVDDVDLAVLHQANQRILDAATSDLGIPSDRVVMNLDRYGNTTGGTIPLALDEAMQEGRIQPGQHVLMCGFGSGLTWGTGIFRW